MCHILPSGIQFFFFFFRKFELIILRKKFGINEETTIKFTFCKWKAKGCVLSIGNKCKETEKNMFEWICFVEPNKQGLIEKIIFQVNGNDFTVVESPFQITKQSSDPCVVDITVVWKENLNKDASSFNYQLQFNRKESFSTHKIDFLK